MFVEIGFAGDVWFTNPQNNQIFYPAYGSNSMYVYVTYNGSPTEDPYWWGISKYVLYLDGQMIEDGEPPVYSSYIVSGFGTHTFKVVMWEWYFGWQEYPTHEKTVTFYLQPTYRVGVKNDFAGGDLRTEVATISPAYTYYDVSLDGITVDVPNNKTLVMTAFDNQTGSDGLLRNWNQWTNGSYNSSNLTISLPITYDETYTAYFHKQPTAPQNAASVSQSEIQLSWTANPEPDVTGYEVWRSINSQGGGPGTFSQVAFVTTNSFTDYDLGYSGNWKVYYKIKAKNSHNQTSQFSNMVTETSSGFVKKIGNISSIPVENSLKQNYPNPFNPATVIGYQLKANSTVLLKVYDIFGREVGSLAQGYKEAGQYQAAFDGAKLSSGTYIARLTAYPQDGSTPFTQTMRMLLMK